MINLFEISKPISTSEFLNYESGIWFVKLTPEVLTLLDGYYDNTNTRLFRRISSVFVDDTIYLAVASIAELRDQQESYFFDITEQILVIHFLLGNPPLGKIITIGVDIGYCDKVDMSRADKSVYDGIYYEPRLLSSPSISQSKDPLFNGLLKFSGCNVQLINADSELDELFTFNLFRQKASIKTGEEGMEYSEYTNLFTGYVDGMSTGKNFSVKVQDMRKGLSRKLAKNIFTFSEFSFLDEGDVDKIKPLIYGDVKNIPLVCVDTTLESADPYSFFIADTEYWPITSVSRVYIDGVENTSYDVDLDSGILTIPADDVFEFRDSVTADVVGSPISNSLEIIIDIMSKYAGINLTSYNYNLVEIASAISLCRNSGIYIDDESEIIKVIENLCNDSDMVFMVQDDGKYTARVYDSNRAIKKTIENDEWFDEPDVSIDTSEFLSSCTINYSKDQSTGDFLSVKNTDYELEVLGRYKAYKEKTFETNLTSEDDALAKSEVIMGFSKNIPKIVKRKTIFGHSDLTVMDFIYCNPEYIYGSDGEKATWEVLSVTKNLQQEKVELTLKFIR